MSKPKESVYVKAAKSSRQKAPGAETTYTNRDLERMFGAPAAPATTPTSSDGDDSLNWLEEQRTARAERVANIVEAEAEVAAARKSLKNLEVQLLATRNPFSARPKLSEEEVEYRVQGEGAAARNRRTQVLVDEARQELKEAEARLDLARR